MTISVVDMKTAVFDYARPSKYSVTITAPDQSDDNAIISAIQNYFSAERQVNLNCNTASFPSISVSTFEQKIKGPMEKFPYEMTYEDFELEFYLDHNHTERKFFIDWINRIKNPVTNNFNYKENYISDIEISQLDNLTFETFAVKLIDAFPTNISEVQLGYDQTDAVETFTVSFNYKYWVVERENTGNTSELASLIGGRAFGQF